MYHTIMHWPMPLFFQFIISFIKLKYDILPFVSSIAHLHRMYNTKHQFTMLLFHRRVLLVISCLGKTTKILYAEEEFPGFLLSRLVILFCSVKQQTIITTLRKTPLLLLSHLYSIPIQLMCSYNNEGIIW